MLRNLVHVALGNGRRALAALALAVLLAGPEPSAAQTADPNAWRVVALSGEVALRRGGATPIAFASSDALLPGDTLQTGPGGRLVLRRGEDSVVVAPNSSVTLPVTSPGGLTSLIQSLGTLLVKVDRRATPNFEVRTPYLIAVVKGTSFSVTVDRSGAGVHVLQGLVQVSDARSNAPPALLTPGSTARMPAAPGRPMQLDGPARRSMEATPASATMSVGVQDQAGSAPSAPPPAGAAQPAAAASAPIQANAPAIGQIGTAVTLGGVGSALQSLPVVVSEARGAASASAPKPVSEVTMAVTPFAVTAALLIAQPLALAAVDVESSSRGLVGNDGGGRDKPGSRGDRGGRGGSAGADRDGDKDDDKDKGRKRGDDSGDGGKRSDDSRDGKKGGAGDSRDGGSRSSFAMSDGKGGRGGSDLGDSKGGRSSFALADGKSSGGGFSAGVSSVSGKGSTSVVALSIGSLESESHSGGDSKRRKKGRDEDRKRRK